MEQSLNPMQQKYISRFIATFLPENRNVAKVYKIEFTKVAVLLLAVVELKSGHKPGLADVYLAFKALRYEYITNNESNQASDVFKDQLFLNIEPSKIEALSLLKKYLYGTKKVQFTNRLQELNLQVDIFNKLYPLQSTAA